MVGAPAGLVGALSDGRGSQFRGGGYVATIVALNRDLREGRRGPKSDWGIVWRERVTDMRFYHNLRAGGPLFETTLKELDALVTAHAEPRNRQDALYSLKSAVNWLLNPQK